MDRMRIKGIFLRYFYSLIKGPQHFTDIFYWPFIDILLWGLAAIWIQKEDQNGKLPLVLMSGLVFWQVFLRGAVDIGVCLLQEFWNKNLINIFSTPTKLIEWVAGVLLFCCLKLSLSILFSFALVYFLYGVAVFSIGMVFLPYLVCLFFFGLSAGFISSGLIVYWGKQVEVLAWTFGFLFAPFSAVFYPISVLPGTIQKIALFLPSSYVFEEMRNILNHQFVSFASLGVTACLTAIYLFLSFSFFYMMFEKSRNLGLNRTL